MRERNSKARRSRRQALAPFSDAAIFGGLVAKLDFDIGR